MADISTTTEVQQAAATIDGATNPQVIDEAINGLEDAGNSQEIIAEITSTAVLNGDLPELMIGFSASENLKFLDLTNDNNIGGAEEISAMRAAAEKGYIERDGQLITLTFAERVYASAAAENFETIRKNVGQRSDDEVINVQHDFIDGADSMGREIGEMRIGLEFASYMFANPDDGSFNNEKYSQMFGSDSPTRADIQEFRESQKYRDLSPAQREAVDSLYDNFSELNSSGDGRLTGDDLWHEASNRGISMHPEAGQQDALAERMNTYNDMHSVVEDMTPQEVDELVRRLAISQGEGELPLFEKLDLMDGEDDGLLSKDVLDNAVPSNDTDAAAINTLREHFDQFDRDVHKDGVINLAEVSAKSESYQTKDRDNNQVFELINNELAAEKEELSTDTSGDLHDDLESTVATFGGDDGNFSESKWKDMFFDGGTEDQQSLAVDRAGILDFMGSEKFQQLSPSEQRGVASMYDHFDTIASASGTPESIEPADIWQKAGNLGINWRDNRDQIRSNAGAYDASVSLPTSGQIEDTMDTIYGNDPGPETEQTVFETLTGYDGQTGRPEDRAGFSVGSIDKALEHYETVLGADTGEYRRIRERLNSVKENFADYDSDGDGLIGFKDLQSISGDERIVGDLNRSTQPATQTELSALAQGADQNVLAENFVGKAEINRGEVKKLMEGLPADDPTRQFLQYVSDHYKELAKSDGKKGLSAVDLDKYLETAQFDGATAATAIAQAEAAEAEAGATEDGEAEDLAAESVVLDHWVGGEDYHKFGAIINPADPYAGALKLAEMNGLTIEELGERFFLFDPNLKIPQSVYDAYYGAGT